MNLVPVVVIIVLGLFSESSAEICRKDRECLGYVRFSGHRCEKRRCTCKYTRGCSYYTAVAKKANHYWCKKKTDCEAHNEYPGIFCINGKCGCTKHYACGGCIPRIKVLRMARNLNETCIFNLKSDPPFWTVIVETDWGSLTPGDKCFDLNWKAADTFWKIYSINHTNNFEILEENLVSTQYIKGRWGNLDNVGGITINGLYAIKVNVHVTSKYWFNKYYLLKGYFSRGCASWDYSPENPKCAKLNEELIHIENAPFNYSYHLKNCFSIQSYYYPAEPVHTIQGCSVAISCPLGCHSYQNRQVFTEFTVNIGCPYTIKLMELVIRNCPKKDYNSCWYKDKVVDRSWRDSVKYKPEPWTYGWNYHGLFIRVYVTTATSISGVKLIKYGPVPTQGSCTIFPTTGYTLTTLYNLTCTGFTVPENIKLYFRIFTNHEAIQKTASMIYQGDSPNRPSMLLQQGTEANDYMVYIWVKASVFYGSYVQTMVQTQVRPPRMDESDSGDLVTLAEGFLKVDEKETSFVQDLISKGDTEDATHLLGIISSSLNLEVKETKTSTVKALKKTQVRTGIVTVLKKIPVTNIKAVSSTLSVLNDATVVKEEVSEETKETATDLYINLADNFDNFVEESTVDVKDIAGSLINGVTRMLDLNTDMAFNIEQVKLLAQTEVGTPIGEESSLAVQNVEAVAKMKNSTVKLLNTLSKVSNTLVGSQPLGANCSLFKSNTMTVGVQKILKRRLATAAYTATGNLNSSGSIRFSEIGELEEGEHGVKMLYMDKNPYVWAAAKDITSPVMSVSLSVNGTDVDVHDLNDPIIVALSSTSVPQSRKITIWAFIMKYRIDLRDQDGGNLTFDKSRSNMMTFNVTAVSSRTIRISVIPLGKITHFKMLIKTDGTPTLDEIISDGFLYPEEIPRSLFAEFNLSRKAFAPITDEERFSFYVTPINSLSTNNYTSDMNSTFTGIYYIGMTLDLTHNRTLQQLKENYPSCLGSRQIGCREVVIAPITIQTSQLGCFYWDEDRDVWSAEGCEVSPYSVNANIECHCTHLTSFSGSMLVMPNFVDPLDVGLFLTIFDNPVVFAAVVIVWVIYFFLIHWARQADKKDLEKVGVINCLDNNPSNNYIYLVCAVTGWWKDAGTTANVFIFLKGSKGRSSSHCLTSAGRLCFQSGSEDWFLITTEQSLGNLQSVTMWHDNMGASPRWYLNHVYVKDLQLKKSWYFIYNDWLAVDRGHMLQTSATMEATTEEAIRFKQKYNFMVKSTHDLRDGHLWLSIFYKPARSSFTRVQRLTCALSFLLMTMLTNIMFYGIPTDEPEDQAVMAGNISISLSTIIIGIESSLIMFPINLIILQLFLKVKPKPWKRTVKSFLKEDIHVQKMYDASRKMADMMMRNILQRIVDNESSDQGSLGENNNADPDQEESLSFMAKESRSSGSLSGSSVFSVEATLVGEKSDSEKAPATNPLPAPRSSKVLPWWFIHIAWFLVMSTSIVSSYFVLLYGFKYGYNKSVSWLVSFLTGFTQSAFVTQPLKVIVIAIIVTLIFKKPAEFDDFGPDVELDKDEVYLHEVKGAEEMHHPTVEPLSKFLLSRLRERLYLEWLMDNTIRDIALYVIYTTVVIFMVHGNRNVTLAYQNTNALEKLLLSTSCLEGENCVSLANAKTVEGMFGYIEKVLIPVFREMSVADHDNLTLGTNHYLLGPLRIRQQRIKTGTCHSMRASTFKKFGVDLPECVSSYSFDNEDIGSYSNSWKIPLSGPSSGMGPWSYQSSWKLKTVPYNAAHATYSGGGFVLEIPLNGTEVTRLNEMRNTDWIDDRTRAVFIEFTLYNPNVDMISVVMILFEYTSMGGIFPEHHVYTTKLDHHNASMGPYIALSEVVFLLFNIAFIYIEVKRYRKAGRREYFKDKWSIVEILQMATAWTVIGLFFQRLAAVTLTLEKFRESNRSSFVSFYPAIISDLMVGNVMAFLVAVVIVKALKLLQFNKKMFMIADTVALAKYNLFCFAFMFVIAMIAFGHFTTLAFGSSLYVYQSFGSSLETLFEFAIGISDVLELYEISKFLGPLYFIAFILFLKWSLLTIFVAILNFGFNDSKARTAQRKNKFELIDYIVGRIRDVL